jgi:hypothetical protein
MFDVHSGSAWLALGVFNVVVWIAIYAAIRNYGNDGKGASFGWDYEDACYIPFVGVCLLIFIFSVSFFFILTGYCLLCAIFGLGFSGYNIVRDHQEERVKSGIAEKIGIYFLLTILMICFAPGAVVFAIVDGAFHLRFPWEKWESKK